MRILYVSVHSTLEYNELKMLAELGHEVFSLGAYHVPSGNPNLPRPGLDIPYNKKLDEESMKFPRTDIPDSFLNNFDLTIVMHSPDILQMNAQKFKGRKVIWRSIGQSNRGVEAAMLPLRNQGMKIVRMSPKEKNIPGYVGEDEMIRFYQDENELKDWNGKDRNVINFTQSLKGRRIFCHYDQIMECLAGYGAKVYGPGNEDLGGLNGGELSWEKSKEAMRNNRVYLATGTWPSPYTLAVSEAMMTGIPLVCIGKKLAEEVPGTEFIDFYEISDMIQNGVNGFIADDIGTLRGYIYQLLNDDALAKAISLEGRKTAIAYFSKQPILDQWRNLLNTI